MDKIFVISALLMLVFMTVGLIYAFRRIMNKNVVLATKHLDDLNQEYTQKEKEVNRQLEEAKQKAAAMVLQAQNEAEKAKAEIIQAAESEREKIIADARAQGNELMQQADKSRQLLLAEIHERIEKEAINTACELIQNTLPEHFKQDVHVHWVEELITNGFSKLEHLRLPTDIKEIKITSAFALHDDVHKTLVKKLKDILGYEVALKEEVDSKLVAGLCITLGSLVLDGTLRNKILAQAKKV